MRKTLIAACVVISVLTFCGAAFAWPDGDREGLLMGVTGGFGNTEFDAGSGTYDGTGLMVGAYLGAGLSEQVLLTFRYRYYNTSIDSIDFHTFLWEGDMIFFPSVESGLFLTFGLGRALVTADNYYIPDRGGTVFHAGVGYEISKWVFLMADYTHVSLEDSISGRSITFAIAAIGY